MKMSIYAATSYPLGETHLAAFRAAKQLVDNATYLLSVMEFNDGAEDAWSDLTDDEKKGRYLSRRRKIHAAVEAAKKLIEEYQQTGGFCSPIGIIEM
jgi:hypothetical protein